jgi:hypothetical protein
MDVNIRRRNSVWNFYKFQQDPNGKPGKQIATCKICEKELSYSVQGGIGHLMRHVSINNKGEENQEQL